MRDLTHSEYAAIDEMDAEDYSNFLAYGVQLMPDLSINEIEAYERWSRSQREFDL